MILDVLGNVHRYMVHNKEFSKAIEFLFRPDLNELPTGKYEIDGDRVYAIVAKDPGRKEEDALLEIHRKYIDIQVVLAGTDNMGWRSKSSCEKPSGEYHNDSDVQFFEDDPEAFFSVKRGRFVIFFPEDAHMPSISEGEIHKIIVKVAVDNHSPTV
jgi:YhcH/YjgK/YiaL family protein